MKEKAQMDGIDLEAQPDWMDFCDGLDFGALVPKEFERYRPAIADGLVFFLENLAPDRAIGILADQAELADETSVGERLVAIAHHCPALHKLGQVMARDRRLPSTFRRHLQRLETMTPSQTLEDLRVQLEAELGPLDDLGIRLDEEPLAEASVSVVLPFTWRDDGESKDRRGVFKVLKPGIEQKLGEELDVLQRIGALLDDRCHHYGIPEIAYEDTFGQVRDLLRHEVHLEEEQRNLGAARAAYSGMDSVIVPEVFPFSTPGLTAMERIDGRKVTDVGLMSAEERRRLANLVVEALIAHAIWSPGPTTMYHADPHAGNLMVTEDLRLAILDWSLVGTLSKNDQVRLSRVLFGAMTLDRGRIADAIAELAEGEIDAIELSRIVDESLQPLRDGKWPGVRWLTRLMDDAVTRARGRFGPNLVIFRKVLQTLNGVIADISEATRADWVLASVFAKRLGAETTGRMTAQPFSRTFSTHVSNVELAHLLFSAPLTASRYWLNLQQKLVRRHLPRQR